MKGFIRLTETLVAWMMVGVLGILPLLFLPLTQDFYDTPKWFFLVSLALVLTLVWTLRSLVTRTVTVSRSPAAIGMLTMALASLLSLAFSSTNRVEALLTPIGAGTWVSLSLLFLFGETFLSPVHRSFLRTLLVMSASLLGVVAVYQVFGLGKAMIPGLSFLTDPSFSPAGANIGLATILALCLPLAIHRCLRSIRNQKDIAIALFVVAVVAIAGGLAATLWQLLPTLPNFLPFSYGWAITLEALKIWKHFLVGVGAENFMYAFTQGRPVGLNYTALWNVRFSANSSLLLHLATVYGLAGLVGMALLVRSLLIPFRVSVVAASKLLAVGVLFFVQPQFVTLIAVAIFLLSDERKGLHVLRPARTLFLFFIGIGLATVTLVALYGLGRVFTSELTFMRSLQARATGDGQATYNLQIQALNLNPWSTRFRIAYSQTNLDIANAIARATPQNSLTEADRQTITTLIQQAIREAKTAVAISPNNILAWENLTRLYQNLASVAQGADQWAITSYQQTIALDPTNPLLRVSYANFLESQSNIDSAFAQYQQATRLKSDYALAHYSLARIYRGRQQYFLEAQTLAETLSFVTRGTNDEAQVQSELAAAKAHLTDEERAQIEQRAGGRQATSSSQLLSPLPQTPPELEPKLNFPTEASPGALP